MVFAASVTSSPNGSPGFGVGAVCATAPPNISPVARSTNAARRVTGIEISWRRLVALVRLIARRQPARLPKPGASFARNRWRSAVLSPYKPMRKDQEMSTLAGHAFVKMNGLGNEIVVVDMRAAPAPIAAAEARAVASPQGAPYDQMMALYPPNTPGTDAYVRIYNSDGSP